MALLKNDEPPPDGDDDGSGPHGRPSSPIRLMNNPMFNKFANSDTEGGASDFDEDSKRDVPVGGISGMI